MKCPLKVKENRSLREKESSGKRLDVRNVRCDILVLVHVMFDSANQLTVKNGASQIYIHYPAPIIRYAVDQN